MLKKIIAVSILSILSISNTLYANDKFENEEKLKESFMEISKVKNSGDISFKFIKLKLKENDIKGYDKIKEEVDLGKDVIETIKKYGEVLNYKTLELNNVKYKEKLVYNIKNNYQNYFNGNSFEVETNTFINLYLTGVVNDKNESFVNIMYNSKDTINDSLSDSGIGYDRKEFIQTYKIKNGSDKLITMFANTTLKKEMIVDLVVLKIK